MSSERGIANILRRVRGTSAEVLLARLVQFLSITTAIGWPVSAWLNDEPVGYEFQTAGVTVDPAFSGAAGDSVGAAPGLALMTVTDPSTSERLLVAAPTIAYAAVTVLILEILIRLFRDIRGARPFRRANANRLRIIAALVSFGWTGADNVRVMVANRLLPTDAARQGFDAPVEGFLLGLVIMMLAQAFAAGTRMQEENDRVI